MPPLRPDKRLKYTEPQPCLHCNSYTHTWNECIWPCLHCTVFHPRRRCRALNIDYYTPGGFQVHTPSLAHTTVSHVINEVDVEGEAEASNALQNIPVFSLRVHELKNAYAPRGVSAHQHTEGFNADRAAMIATPAPPPPNPTEPESPVGPERTGMNTIPLGPKKPLGTSWPRGAAISKKPILPAVIPPSPIISQAAKSGLRNIKQEQAIWQALKKHIEDAVDATAAKSKKFNGLGDRARVQRKVESVLGVLKPMITGVDAASVEDLNVVKIAGTTMSLSHRPAPGQAPGAEGKV